VTSTRAVVERFSSMREGCETNAQGGVDRFVQRSDKMISIEGSTISTSTPQTKNSLNRGCEYW
jgi:hypothetical protein